MQFDTSKMAPKVQEALIQASALAERHRQNELEPEHLLLVMLGQVGGVVPQILAKLSVPIEAVMAEVRRSMLRFPPGASEINMTISQRLRYLFMNAQEEAERMGETNISGEHILLALVVSAKGKRGAKRVGQSGVTREVGDILLAYNVNQESLLSIMEEIRRMRKPQQNLPFGGPGSALGQFGRNLVVMAREGGLDPVVGREEEAGMILQVLSKPSQNNPILVGGSGVGKTTIVEGLAQILARGEVPAQFHNKEIIALDKDALIGGVKTRAELEERFKAVLREVIENPATILFIDDLDTILGSPEQGGLDLAGVLMPVLNHFELRFVSVCSQQAFDLFAGRIHEFAQYFYPIPVKPPSVEDTILILRELRSGYEAHHGVSISDEALVAASVLSNKYIPDRQLPEKAIDLIDEASARLRMELRATDPMGAAEPNQRSQYENERQAPAQDSGNAEAIARLRAKIEEVQSQIMQAQDSFDTLRAADLQFCTLPALESELGMLEQKAPAAPASYPPERRRQPRLTTNRQVSEEDIQMIISQYIGVPPERIVVNPAKRLNNLEEIIGDRLIGQRMAIEAVANAVRRSSGGYASPNRPLGSFLFLGPSGVGKTVLARILADVIYGSDQKVARLDLAMYSDHDAVFRLIGDADNANSEPGHLIEIIQNDPEIVLVLDSIEKAHINVQSLLQQIMEDGYLSDGSDQVLSFSDTIIVMKCGVGAEVISQMTGRTPSSILPALQAELSRYLRQEFLVSLDEIIIFEALKQDELVRLIDANLCDLKQRLAEKGLTITLTSAAYMRLIDDANVSMLGARLIRRVVQQKVQNPIAIKILQGQFSHGSILVEISHKSGEIIFTPG
ncbi:MAG: ATP-dependent Clp protease ATP-binding subunit [Peptococcaceae bacterium]|nr:ATP-dependent Clp protease ATP-binding subunit [Peptococcaceae bacterium]